MIGLFGLGEESLLSYTYRRVIDCLIFAIRLKFRTRKDTVSDRDTISGHFAFLIRINYINI